VFSIRFNDNSEVAYFLLGHPVDTISYLYRSFNHSNWWRHKLGQA